MLNFAISCDINIAAAIAIDQRICDSINDPGTFMNKHRWNYVPLLTLSLPVFCSAATLSVDRTDPACSDIAGTPYCSITAGISNASAGDTVSVGAGTYYEHLIIPKDLILEGAGADATYIDGSHSGRTVSTVGTVTISNVTIQNGDAGDTGLGGGIAVGSGGLTLTDAVIANNHASDGGGIFTYADAALLLVRTLVTGNVASNSMGTSSGGGLYLSGYENIDIRESTISDNSSEYSGGGIFNMSPSTTLTNSTLSGNVVSGGEGGGAIANGSGSSGSITLSSVTITGNTAAAAIGGIYNANGIVHLHNTVIAGNTDSGYAPDCGGMTITSDGYNFVGTTAGCDLSSGSGDILNLGEGVAKLGPLANNGGLALTHAILSGSALIDAGDPSGCSDEVGTVLTGDETGGTRAVDGNADGSALCDIGAFELKHGVVVDAGSSSLVTTESQGTVTFDVVLVSRPTADVTLSIASSDSTEGTVSPGALTFTAANWFVRQQVVVTGVDDSAVDGDVGYAVSFGITGSMDPNYDAITLSDLTLTNSDNDAAAVSSGGDDGGGGSLDIVFLSMIMVGSGVRWKRHR